MGEQMKPKPKDADKPVTREEYEATLKELRVK